MDGEKITKSLRMFLFGYQDSTDFLTYPLNVVEKCAQSIKVMKNFCAKCTLTLFAQDVRIIA